MCNSHSLMQYRPHLGAWQVFECALRGRERTGAVPGYFIQGDSFGAVSSHGKRKNPH